MSFSAIRDRPYMRNQAFLRTERNLNRMSKARGDMVRPRGVTCFPGHRRLRNLNTRLDQNLVISGSHEVGRQRAEIEEAL